MPSPVKSSAYHYDSVLRKCTVRGTAVLPGEIFEIADDIEILDASSGHLSSLPDTLGDLKNLRIAFFSDNDFTDIPRVLSSCRNLEMVGFKSCKINRLETDALPEGLRGLILTDNMLTELPGSIGDCAQLQKLMLTGNRLTALPDSILGCANLELLRVSMNRMDRSPDWLFRLPKLAWYSDSQNLFNPVRSAAIAAMPELSWGDLHVAGVLGQSSKNVVYRADLAGRPLAIKLFGTGITTDGAPADEMYASLLAGDHPNVIGGVAGVRGHPDGREGFAMPLISPDYMPLGLPPDLKTLTRDVFGDGVRFSAGFITQVATDVASALAHLSGRGIQHGDVYAHNVLSRSDGRSYIGDFGAASVYGPGTISGRRREQTDVRGFGYLLDDLLAKSAPEAPVRLSDLRDACLTEDPGSRPAFSEIVSMLAG